MGALTLCGTCGACWIIKVQKIKQVYIVFIMYLIGNTIIIILTIIQIKLKSALILWKSIVDLCISEAGLIR